VWPRHHQALHVERVVLGFASEPGWRVNQGENDVDGAEGERYEVSQADQHAEPGDGPAVGTPRERVPDQQRDRPHDGHHGEGLKEQVKLRRHGKAKQADEQRRPDRAVPPQDDEVGNQRQQHAEPEVQLPRADVIDLVRGESVNSPGDQRRQEFAGEPAAQHEGGPARGRNGEQHEQVERHQRTGYGSDRKHQDRDRADRGGPGQVVPGGRADQGCAQRIEPV
jgi:hypothetical protein